MRMPSLTVTSICLRDAGAQRRLQGRRDGSPSRRAIAPLGGRAERHAHDFAAAAAVEHAQRLRRDHVRPQLIAKAEIDQGARGVGRELDAGARFLEPLRLFQDDDAKAVAREREGGG